MVGYYKIDISNKVLSEITTTNIILRSNSNVVQLTSNEGFSCQLMISSQYGDLLVCFYIVTYYFGLNSYNIDDNFRINQYEVSDIVMSRIEEILSLTRKEINLLANRKMDYVIITGGVSNMEGFSSVAYDVFGNDVIIGNVNIVGIRNNKYSSAIGNVVYYINRLKLLGIDDTMVDDDLYLSRKGLINVTEETMLGKVFGYFFGDVNEEEM